jgi:hypothetical protein
MSKKSKSNKPSNSSARKNKTTSITTNADEQQQSPESLQAELMKGMTDVTEWERVRHGY